MRRIYLTVAQAREQITAGVPIYALYSGGKDSSTVAHYLASRNQLAAVVTLGTGISAPGWFDFVHQTARDQGWPHEHYDTPISFEALVEKLGFPGPKAHTIFMNQLKGRALRAFKKRHPTAILASGIRRQESKRRMGSAQEYSLFENVPVWAPLINWTDAEVWAYVKKHALQRSPCYGVLGLSGDCLCGAYARPDERALIAAAYPDIETRLVAMERGQEKPWGWGKTWKRPAATTESVLCVECSST